MAESPVSEVSGSERTLLSQVSQERLWKHAETLAQWEKVSGTPGEQAAVDYLKGELEALGLTVTEHRFESLLGWPEAASLQTVSPTRATFEALTNAFTPSTPPDGIEGEVVYVGQGSDAELAGASGKVAMLEGMASPLKVLRGGEAGAIGLIFIQEERLHNMCVSPVWGTPTTKTAGLLAKIPTVSVHRVDGESLKELAAAGELRVRLTAKTFWGWRTTPLLTAQIDAASDPEKFVLLSGHHCSWQFGAMDNGTANATILEVARVLNEHRELLQRSVRIAFWPGHTQGRYSGSTWYFDHFWEDLHDNCVLHVNCDSTGARGAVHYHAIGMAETREFAVDAIRDAIGVEAEPERQSRAGDQSFWSSGVPSIFMSLSLVPGELAAARPAGLLSTVDDTTKLRPGLPWWWHTPEDTIDKIDPEVLVRDTRVYVLSTLRAAAARLLPFRYAPAAREIRTTIERYQQTAGDRIDLGPALAPARATEQAAGAIDAQLHTLGEGAKLDAPTTAALNDALHELDRELVLINFTAAGPFDQDLALPVPPVPLLAPAEQLATLDSTSDAAHFLTTELVRNRNQARYHLRLAEAAAERANALLSSLNATP
ncbi:MAG: M28 family peptidase [Candidatus Dormiibacterota bacterium]